MQVRPLLRLDESRRELHERKAFQKHEYRLDRAHGEYERDRREQHGAIRRDEREDVHELGAAGEREHAFAAARDHGVELPAIRRDAEIEQEADRGDAEILPEDGRPEEYVLAREFEDRVIDRDEGGRDKHEQDDVHADAGPLSSALLGDDAERAREHEQDGGELQPRRHLAEYEIAEYQAEDRCELKERNDRRGRAEREIAPWPASKSTRPTFRTAKSCAPPSRGF